MLLPSHDQIVVCVNQVAPLILYSNSYISSHLVLVSSTPDFATLFSDDNGINSAIKLFRQCQSAKRHMRIRIAHRSEYFCDEYQLGVARVSEGDRLIHISSFT